MTKILACFILLGALSLPAQISPNLQPSETKALTAQNARVQERVTEIAKVQGYLAKAQAKGDARQTASLAKALAGLQKDEAIRQKTFTRTQSGILRHHGAANGGVSPDFKRVVPTQ